MLKTRPMQRQRIRAWEALALESAVPAELVGSALGGDAPEARHPALEFADIGIDVLDVVLRRGIPSLARSEFRALGMSASPRQEPPNPGGCDVPWLLSNFGCSNVRYRDCHSRLLWVRIDAFGVHAATDGRPLPSESRRTSGELGWHQDREPTRFLGEGWRSDAGSKNRRLLGRSSNRKFLSCLNRFQHALWCREPPYEPSS